MAEYPQIEKYFKKFQQGQAKLDEVQRNKKTLDSIVDLDMITNIQASVEERMGPRMCDNTEKQTTNQKNAFLSVLQNFKQQIEKSKQSYHTKFKQMKELMTKEQKIIKQQYLKTQKKWQQNREYLKGYCTSTTNNQQLRRLQQQQNEMCSYLQQRLVQMQHSLEVCLLSQEINRRKQLLQISSKYTS